MGPELERCINNCNIQLEDLTMRTHPYNNLVRILFILNGETACQVETQGGTEGTEGMVVRGHAATKWLILIKLMRSCLQTLGRDWIAFKIEHGFFKKI